MALGQGAGESGAIQHTEQEKHTKELHRTVWNLPNHPVPTRGRDSFHRTSLLQALALNISGMGQPRLHCSRMCICVFCHFQVLRSLCPCSWSRFYLTLRGGWASSTMIPFLPDLCCPKASLILFHHWHQDSAGQGGGYLAMRRRRESTPCKCQRSGRGNIPTGSQGSLTFCLTDRKTKVIQK